MTEEEKQEYADWLDAVKADGKSIEDVPERFKTVELCAEAVKSFTYLLDDWGIESETWDFESEDLKYLRDFYSDYYNCTPELRAKLIKAIKEKKEGLGAFKYVPEEIKDAVHLELYKQDSEGYFPELPEHLKTAEMCLEEVKRDSDMLEYVPESLKNEVRNALEN